MSIFKRKRPAKEWQLKPDHYGTYTLMRWDREKQVYQPVCEKLKEENAVKKIQHLSRPDIYLEGAKKNG